MELENQHSPIKESVAAMIERLKADTFPTLGGGSCWNLQRTVGPSELITFIEELAAAKVPA